MSAKRPRPAIPVLVHVDNPSSGGGSSDMTTVNENTTTLKNIVGTNDSTIADTSLIGAARNLVASVGNFNSTPSTAGSTVRSFLFNLREGIGSSTSTPTATGTTVRDLLTAIKENTASGGGGGEESGADLTTVNEKITTLAAAVGPANAGTGDRNLIGHVINLVGSIGDFNAASTPSGGTVKSYLSNIRNAIGNSTIDPTATETTVRGLLTAIKENTASGGSGGSADLTTVNENTTTMKNAIGTLNSSSKDTDLIGCVRNLRVAVGVSGDQLSLNDTNIRSILYNIRTAIGSGSATPTLTGTSVRDLLTQIKDNTASGGSGGGADLTTVNEKTTALAAAIGSASDSSSTVSVIGLLKSITDKY